MFEICIFMRLTTLNGQIQLMTAKLSGLITACPSAKTLSCEVLQKCNKNKTHNIVFFPPVIPICTFLSDARMQYKVTCLIYDFYLLGNDSL